MREAGKREVGKREKIFDIIEGVKDDSKISRAYDFFMIAIIIVSILPLAFKSQTQLFVWIDHGTVSVFIIDYMLRLITADYKLKKGSASYLVYPVTPMAIIDLLSILPSFSSIDSGFKLFRALRLLRAFRAFRVFKLFRYSENVNIIANVFKKQKDAFIYVGALAFGYIIITALIIFSVEPDTFGNFFDAIWWATLSLTSKGSGDIYPLTTVGKIFTIMSSLVGIAIIALPIGIITAGYMSEINDRRS